MINYKNKKASALILTLVLSFIFISLGLAVSSVTTKEVIRVGVYEKAQRAVEIADIAWECVLYHEYAWDDNFGFFVDGTPDIDNDLIECQYPVIDSDNTICAWALEEKEEGIRSLLSSSESCEGIKDEGAQENIADINIVTDSIDITEKKRKTWEFYLGSQEGQECAKIKIQKYRDNLNSLRTTFNITGYDSCTLNGSRVKTGDIQRKLQFKA